MATSSSMTRTCFNVSPFKLEPDSWTPRQAPKGYPYTQQLPQRQSTWRMSVCVPEMAAMLRHDSVGKSGRLMTEIMARTNTDAKGLIGIP